MRSGSAPQVSVVIPTYNSSEYIARSLASVIAACDGLAYEIILVDDASADVKQLETVARAFPATRIIHKVEKSNAAASRNIGLDAATGRFLFLLDSDDCFEPDHVKHRITIHAAGEHALAFGCFSLDDGNRRWIDHRAHYNGEDIETYLFRRGGDVRSSTISMHRERGAAARFDAGLSKHQDWAFAIAAQRSGFHLAYDDHPGVVIAIGGGHRMSVRSDEVASLTFHDRYLTAPFARQAFLLDRIKKCAAVGDVRGQRRFSAALRATLPPPAVLIKAFGIALLARLGLYRPANATLRLAKRLIARMRP